MAADYRRGAGHRPDVGFLLGYGRDPATWTAEQLADIDACIEAGLAQYERLG